MQRSSWARGAGEGKDEVGEGGFHVKDGPTTWVEGERVRKESDERELAKTDARRSMYKRAWRWEKSVAVLLVGEVRQGAKDLSKPSSGVDVGKKWAEGVLGVQKRGEFATRVAQWPEVYRAM